MKRKSLFFRLVVLVATMMCALGVNAQEAYSCYTSENATLTFYYDNDRSSRTGTIYDLNDGGVDPGWASDFTNLTVKQVVFDPSFEAARPTSTARWFYEMRILEAITGLNYLNTSEVTRMDYMFSRCYKLTSLDLDGFNTSKVTDMGEMFRSCNNLQTIYVGDDWKISDMALAASKDVFKDCNKLVGGKGTTYNANHVDADYAHIDGGIDNPGYFSEKPALIHGDVNGDGEVNIADVTTLINIILGKDIEPTSGVADVNTDGEVNITDVTALVNIILGKEPEPQPETETFTVNGVTFTMVKVEGGTFTMGATPEQGDEANEDEKPSHQVTLSNSYWIGQTEVTQELWQAVMNDNPSDFPGDAQRPVEMVSWYECQEFITKLNEITGKQFRFPTEAEWEFAARGGNRSQGYKYAGSNTLGDVAWYYESSTSELTTHAVATKAPNELGLYDMSGNVKEWCLDGYGPYSSDAQTDPSYPSYEVNHVYRGGGWASPATECRVTFRYSNRYWSNFIGLRLAQ